MDRTNRISQIYGYAVCLVAIITILISLTPRFRAMRMLVTSTLLIVIASGLFFMHWRWLRREDQTT